MYILYVDESGHSGTDLDNPQQPIFSLSGVAVEDHEWYNLNYIFEREKMYISPDFKDVEIHATELFNPVKYSRFYKNSMEENLSILEKVVDLITELQIPIFLSAINKQNFKQYIFKKLGSGIKIDPYIYSFVFLSISYNKYLIDHKKNGMIFLDENKNMIDKLDSVYKKLLIEDFEGETNNIIENALFLQSHKSNFIQIADICNFYINKYISINNYNSVKNEIKKEHCINMYKKLEPLIIDCRNINMLNIVDSFFE